uniref:Ras-related protein Rab n=1 Tax=Cacopsylla melanoneura TaxID=428564 RepID=A0A8D9A3C5_9HEMI
MSYKTKKPILLSSASEEPSIDNWDKASWENVAPIVTEGNDGEIIEIIDPSLKLVRVPSIRKSFRAPPEKLFKVIVIGDPTVGKTSFVQRYVQNTFKKDYKGTVGVDFALKIVQWRDHQKIKLQLWDIAGQERFTWMTRVYYKDAHGCIIMFDLTNQNSFKNTLKWKKDVDSKCTLSDGSPIPCMLLANKCDLPHRQVDINDIESFYKEHNFIGWTETSTKEGLMVNDSMKFLLDVLMRQEGLQNFPNTEKDESMVKLSGPGPKVEKKCSC